MTTRVLDVQAGILSARRDGRRPLRRRQWMSVLRSLAAYQMFRRTRRVHA